MGWSQRVWSHPPADLADELRRRGSEADYFALYETAPAAPAEPLNGLRWIAAGGCRSVHRLDRATPDAWNALAEAWRARPTWWFGVLAYDLKNAFEPSLAPRGAAWHGQPDVALWEPEWVASCALDGRVTVEGDLDAWLAAHPPLTSGGTSKKTPVRPWTFAWSAPDYLERAETLKFHLHRGDIYEVNLCADAQAAGRPDLPRLAQTLQNRAQAGMAGQLHFGDWVVVSASPERYLQVRPDGRAYSQPIKGTAPRSADPAADAASAAALQAAEKERSENIMIVDLVRNDLSRIAAPGSVAVPRCTELQSFATVHHLVSTVEAQLGPGRDWLDAVAASFPMGSMTGAPKLRAMELIDASESRPRGWYSGAMGYVRPDGYADFNVLIRTLFGHLPTDSWQLWAGSALTLAADPEAEWQECLLKAQNPQNVWNESVE